MPPLVDAAVVDVLGGVVHVVMVIGDLLRLLERYTMNLPFLPLSRIVGAFANRVRP